MPTLVEMAEVVEHAPPNYKVARGYGADQSNHALQAPLLLEMGTVERLTAPLIPAALHLGPLPQQFLFEMPTGLWVKVLRSNITSPPIGLGSACAQWFSCH